MSRIWAGAQCEADDGPEQPPCPHHATYAEVVPRPPHGTATRLLCRYHARRAHRAGRTVAALD